MARDHATALSAAFTTRRRLLSELHEARAYISVHIIFQRTTNKLFTARVGWLW